MAAAAYAAQGAAQGEAVPTGRGTVGTGRARPGVPRLTAVNPAARALGLTPGLALADAPAICPALLVRDAEPVADAEELGRWAYGAAATARG